MAQKSNQPILIVEDSDDDYEATYRALKKSGDFNNPIIRCEDGEEALEYLTRKGRYADHQSKMVPALILLDLNLPGRNGKSILSEIKTHEALNKVPIIVLTTSNDSRDVEECYNLGANTFIVKPVNMDSFTQAISSFKEYWFEVAVLPNTEDI